MDVVLVGAPGSGTRALGRDLARRHGWLLVDVDAVAAAADPADRGGPAGPWNVRSAVPRVFLADASLARPRLRHELYRERLVVWLDAPSGRLAARLRAAPILLEGGARSAVPDLDAHRDAMAWYFGAGVRLDATRPTSDLVEEVHRLLASPPPAGTLVARADTRAGLLALGDGIVARGVGDALSGLRGERVVVITERGVWSALGDRVSDVLRAANTQFDVVTIPAGERAKTLTAQVRALRQLARLGLPRKGPIVAVGDDRICDAATFTAGVYLRGVPMVMVPTTTLGQVDLAIGGKGSINLDLGRNLAGTFHQPVGIVLDVDLLRSEAPRQRRAALAEALKYALLGDTELFALVESVAREARHSARAGDDVLLELVERCALEKLRIVLADERDLAGPRMALNLGHTLSHALEAATDYRLLHGEAVGYGLRAALAIGVEVGVTPESLAERAGSILDRLRLGCDPVEVDIADVMARMAADKKRLRGRTRWVLATGSDVVVRSDVPGGVVNEAVRVALLGRPLH